MSYLLDTNICIALLKGSDRKLIEKFSTVLASDFFLCSVVKAELLYGARKSQKVSENLSSLSGFFAQFTSLPFNDQAADWYGSIRASLEKVGKPIGSNDLIIASIAQANRLTLLTRNLREFTQVTGLSVEAW